MASSDLVTLVLAHTGSLLQFLLPIIAICTVLKVIFDVMFDFLYGITPSRRG